MATSEVTFVSSPNELRGKRAAVVAAMLEKLVEASGEPVTWAELTDGVEHPHQYTPALISLELCGIVERWEYIEPGMRKAATAYSLTDEAVEKL